MLSPVSKTIEFALAMVVTAGQQPPCLLTAACKQTLSLTRNHLVPIVSRGQMLRISEVSNCSGVMFWLLRCTSSLLVHYY